MEIFISFLRGVNMTGHNIIKMTDLADLYRKLGFKDAETYIQSGNVIFSSDRGSKESELVLNIEKGILDKFNYIVPVMLRTNQELADLFNTNPFLEEPDFDPSKMAVIFLHEEPSDNQLQKVADVDYPPDKFKIIGREIFTYCPNGFGKTKIYTNFFEKKMGVTGTARNWKTVSTLLSLCNPPTPLKGGLSSFL
jgi:uncharacterized protein (DUF1697 family)